MVFKITLMKIECENTKDCPFISTLEDFTNIYLLRLENNLLKNLKGIKNLETLNEINLHLNLK